MGDVKRYTYRYSEVDGELHRVEEPEGRFVLHSDYEEMETNRNQLGWAITGLVAENERLDDELATLRAENERLKGEVEISEALQDKAWRDGAKAGWNACCIEDPLKRQQMYDEITRREEGNLAQIVNKRRANHPPHG